MTVENTIQKAKRVCYACGSDETYEDKRGGIHWYGNKPTDLCLCEKCNNKYIKNPKWHPITNSCRIKFKGKPLLIDDNPHTGVCNWCRAVAPFDCQYTIMHHEKYDENNPLLYTIEICPSCHAYHHHKTKN